MEDSIRRVPRETTIVAVDYPDPPPDGYGYSRHGVGIGIAMLSALLAAMICAGKDPALIFCLALTLVVLVVIFVKERVEDKRQRRVEEKRQRKWKDQ